MRRRPGGRGRQLLSAAATVDMLRREGETVLATRLTNTLIACIATARPGGMVTLREISVALGLRTGRNESIRRQLEALFSMGLLARYNFSRCGRRYHRYRVTCAFHRGSPASGDG